MVASFLSYYDFWSYHEYWYIYHTMFFIPISVRVLINIDIKYIKQNFYSMAWVMPQGWELRVLGYQSK